MAAILSRYGVLERFSRTWLSSVIVILSLAAVVAYGGPAWGNWVHWALLTVAFILIACGNDLFGALVGSASRVYWRNFIQFVSATWCLPVLCIQLCYRAP